MLAAAAFGESVKTAPGGVDAAGECVYAGVDGAEAGLGFTHGNATLRLKLSNPGATSRTVRVTIPFTDRSRVYSGTVMRILRLHASTNIAAGASINWDIPVPLVGHLDFTTFSGDSPNAMRIEDSDGGEATVSSLAIFGHTAANGFRVLYNPAGRITAEDGGAGQDYDGGKLRIVASNGAVNGATAAFAERADISKPDFERFRRWQDLSVFDGIALAAEDWPSLPDAFKESLADWVAAGGILCRFGDAAPDLPPGPYGLGQVCASDGIEQDFSEFDRAVTRAAGRHELATSPLECDVKAADAMLALRGETPFTLILGILLAFCIIAGPLLIMTLARHNCRMVFFWLFPVLAVAFSLAVMGVIVYEKGIHPELRQFVHRIIDERAGRVVTVSDSIILAPFPLMEEVRVDAADSVVEFMSGDTRLFGEDVEYTGTEFVFRGGWAPTLWPVVFRSITVQPLAAKGESRAFIHVPLTGRLQEHFVGVTEERRTAQ